MADNLVIVESPAKAKTIEKYLGKDFTVKSSFGHIRDLDKKTLGIDIEHGFKPDYIVPEEKKKVVSELKAEVKKAKTIWLASDEDREGEAIAWHLNETLSLKNKNTKRIVFNEITKTAILNAVANPREIDINLVNAQQARRVLDRIVGYEISPVLWKKVKPALSAGRVQSVAVRLIVDKEKEIEGFTDTYNFKVTASFVDKQTNSVLNAVLNRRFDTQEQSADFLKDCLKAKFTVHAVENKPGKKQPAPPFTTSTLQQEASRKLGFTVAQTMVVAQQLYEAGYITYMRTDSVNLSSYALEQAKEIIPTMFGKEYYKGRKFTTKSKGAQEAHEAIRPTVLSRTEIEGDNYQKRLYNLIWKRMIASQMADAKIEKTTIDIALDNNPNVFVCQAEVVLFDGFLKLYQVSVDEEDGQEQQPTLIPKIAVNTPLTLIESKAQQNHSSQPSRYNEASLVKKLEDLGIGRPSTYAPTISTIQKREYVEKLNLPALQREIIVLTAKDGEISSKTETESFGKQTNKLAPTDIGRIVNTFLENNFKDIVDYNFTADVEKHFDSIAQGNEDWQKMLANFYKPFIQEVNNAKQNNEKQHGERLLGIDPSSGHNVYAKIGRYGAMIQIGEAKNEKGEKPIFASLKANQSINTITLQEALALFALPRNLGQYQGKDVVVCSGRFGAYIKWNDKNITLPKSCDPYTVELSSCISEIEKKIAKDNLVKDLPKQVALLDNQPIELNYGRYGLYLSFKQKNYKLPKGIEIDNITQQDAIDIVSGKKKASNTEPLRVFDNGAQVLKGRYGEYIKFDGKNYKMPKGFDNKSLTNEELLKVIGK